MSYEYKEKIKEDLEYSLEGVSIDYYSSEELIHKQKVKELDNVYTQAAKADEYEAKAKAYDDTLKTLDKLINNDERYKEARSNNFVAGMLLAYEKTSILMEDYIKENGGYDA